MEPYEELFRLNFSTAIHPKKEVLAHCSRCGNEVDRFTYTASRDKIVKKRQLMSKIYRCPFCKAKYK